jgi:hypothetical protein
LVSVHAIRKCFTRLSFRCCRQLYQETRDFLHRTTISFSSDPESGCMLSNVPYLHELDLSKGSCIKFELNPFQYTTSITKLWKSLLWTCHFLEKAPHILRLEIECDGRLPRLRPPMYINEVDLKRSPLIIVLLLQPFNLLYNVGQAKVTILRGPLNNQFPQIFNCRVSQPALRNKWKYPNCPTRCIYQIFDKCTMGCSKAVECFGMMILTGMHM